MSHSMHTDLLDPDLVVLSSCDEWKTLPMSNATTASRLPPDHPFADFSSKMGVADLPPRKFTREAEEKISDILLSKVVYATAQ